MEIKLKIVISIIFSILVFESGATNYDFIEDGKTWWYQCSYPTSDGVKVSHYGCMLSDVEVINGKCYTPIWIVNGKKQKILSDPVALIREEDSIIYEYKLDKKEEDLSIPNDIKRIYYDENEIYYYTPKISDNSMDGTEFILYNFSIENNQNAEEILYWPWSYIEYYHRNSWSEIINDNSHSINFKYLADPSVVEDPEDLQMTISSYLGVTEVIKNYRKSSGGCFYHPNPIDHDITGIGLYTSLQYVTDNENNIIFTGVGGEKIWEESKIERLEAEPVDNFHIYNLYGIEVNNPKVGNIHIRTDGIKTEKIIF